MVLKIPDRDYSGSCQIRLLEDILRRRSEYAGGLIVANEVDQIQEGLVGFCARAMMPIVFVDVEPFRDIGNYPPHTAFVGYAADKIGELAAGWVVGYLRRKHIRRPRVLVISGDAHHERERVFCRLLGSAIRDAQITQDSAEFDRMRAREVARKHLRRFISAGQQPHVIFCTNDEMALGVVDALLFSDATAAGDVVVVGVDGTPQTRALIDAGPSPLRATVIQDASKVAETAAELMVKMIRNENIPTCTRLTGDVLARD